MSREHEEADAGELMCLTVRPHLGSEGMRSEWNWQMEGETGGLDAVQEHILWHEGGLVGVNE